MGARWGPQQGRFVLEKGTPGGGCSPARDDTQPGPLVMAVGRCHPRSGHESHGCRDAGGCGRGPGVSALVCAFCCAHNRSTHHQPVSFTLGGKLIEPLGPDLFNRNLNYSSFEMVY